MHLSTPFSERNFIRNTSLPEFGPDLLKVLNADNPAKPLKGNSAAAQVQRGAQLFGIDLVAFAKRTIGNKAIPATGDLKDNAIADDRGLNCVGCHTPIRRTGQSPTALTASGVGSSHRCTRRHWQRRRRCRRSHPRPPRCPAPRPPPMAPPRAAPSPAPRIVLPTACALASSRNGAICASAEASQAAMVLTIPDHAQGAAIKASHS